tara:strand:+ start:604 stop:1032 length:429 start_codon:yes stop_codon:yes gene_type:complete
MIKYKLICNNCNFTFDSWFASSEEYEKLKKGKYLNCHKCSSKKIDKTLMAPRLINKFSSKISEENLIKYKQTTKKIREYQKFIKDNFEYVGKNFAFEARSIHYNNKKNDKGIYGSASKNEIKELKEEGVNFEMIPWVEDKSN